MRVNRRTLLAGWGGSLATPQNSTQKQVQVTFQQFLEASVVSRSTIDRFLHGPSWARFDPLLGYVPGSFLPPDGMDSSSSISTVQSNGARTSYLYADRPCRINTYGDSFTHGDQVNDGETWQEYLAGHLGEPIRNFGVGGYGVYQSYLRMKREERTSHSAQYLIFYMWGDDHIRSLLRCRHAIIYRFWSDLGGAMFHANYWTHLEMNLKTGEFEERPNILNTPTALYQMTEPGFMVQQLHDDLALRLYAVAMGYTSDVDVADVKPLAERLGYEADWNNASEIKRQAQELLDRYSLEATRFTLARAREFARQNGKKLLVVLFDPQRVMRRLIQNEARYDQPIVDYLQKERFDYFDMNEVHVRDFERYRIPFEEYRKLYFIGHYNPRGNHFFAYAIKDTVVSSLDPKPITYRKRDQGLVDFEGYLKTMR
jgi:hypothetical protein